MITDLGAVLAGVLRLTYNDREATIEEHITTFDKKWAFMKSTVSSGEFDEHTKTFGVPLKGLSESDCAKTELLLLTLPPFYSQLVENIQTKGKITYAET